MNRQLRELRYTRVSDLWVNLSKYQQRLQKTTTGCWQWTGAQHTQGYGMVSAIRVSDERRIMTVAHRVAMRLKLGRSLGREDDVQHLCGNPRCCNPDHLVLKLTMDQRLELERHRDESPQISAHAE